MKKLILTLILGCLSCASWASLTVDPFKIEIKTDAGTYYENHWSLKNNYDRDIQVKITVSDMGSYEENKKFPIEEWLKISPTELTIAKGETAKANYRVEISPQMQGSLAARVSFSIPPESGGMVITKMSMPFHVIVRRTEKFDFEIENLSVAGYDGGYKFIFDVENNGNFILKPQGEISVYKRKKLIASANMAEPAALTSVFTDISRRYFIVLPQALKAGKYRAEAKIYAFGYEVAKTAVQTIKFKILKDGSIKTLEK
jgi:hypothetical protein